MRSGHLLPGLLRVSDFAAVNPQSRGQQRKTAPVDNLPNCQPGAANYKIEHTFSGYLILNISGAFWPVSPVNATKRMLFCCVREGFLYDHFTSGPPQLNKINVLCRSPFCHRSSYQSNTKTSYHSGARNVNSFSSRYALCGGDISLQAAYPPSHKRA